MNWKFYSILATVLFSISSLLLRKYETLNKELTSFQVLCGVTILSFIIISVVLLFNGSKRKEIRNVFFNRYFLLFIGIYSLLYIIADLVYYKAHIETPNIVLLLAIIIGGIAIESIGSYYLFGDKIGKTSIIGIVLILLGVFMLKS